MSAPAPGAGRRAIHPYVLRTLPDRLPPRPRCGQHPAVPALPVLRRGWVCPGCTAERPAGG